MKKIWLIVVLILVLIGGIVSCVSDDDSGSYDDVMAGYDWGDHSYYNRDNHSVEWTPWK